MDSTPPPEKPDKPGKGPGEHYYEVDYTVCDKSSPYCTIPRVYESLRRFPAPGADGSKPVQTGDETRVTMLGPVRHEVDERSHTVTNTTTSEHMLHPGNVRHEVVDQGDSIGIRTVGRGTGAWGRTNEVFASLLWNLNHDKVKDDVKNQGKKLDK